MSTTVQESPPADVISKYFLQQPLKQLLRMSQDELDQIMATAYQLYQADRYAEAEVLCRGLVAADPAYGWTYSLYSAVLRRQGRLREALSMLDIGLRYEPGQAKLLQMRAELERAILALAKTIEVRREQLTAGAVRNTATPVGVQEVR